jgi:hypothetical protein
MTVREMLARIDSRELSEWQAYYALNPWGPERGDLQAGVIASTIANTASENGGYKPSDFMPDFAPAEPETEKTWQELRDIAIRMAAMMGNGSVKY